MQTNIVIRFTVEGWHNWKDAPEHRAYLSHSHRHLFYVEVWLEVLHDDREVEFHDLLDYCRGEFPTGDLGGQSCEMLARGLIDKLKNRYPQRKLQVSVFEDNEVGAVVTSFRYD